MFYLYLTYMQKKRKKRHNKTVYYRPVKITYQDMNT